MVVICGNTVDDLKMREGEVSARPTVIWVQPPGYAVGGDRLPGRLGGTGRQPVLQAAVDAARALVWGQLASGGWYDRIAKPCSQVDDDPFVGHFGPPMMNGYTPSPQTWMRRVASSKMAACVHQRMASPSSRPA